MFKIIAKELLKHPVIHVRWILTGKYRKYVEVVRMLHDSGRI